MSKCCSGIAEGQMEESFPPTRSKWKSAWKSKQHKSERESEFSTSWSERRVAPGNASGLHIWLGGQQPGQCLLWWGSGWLNLPPARQSVAAKGADRDPAADPDLAPVQLAVAWSPRCVAAVQCIAGCLRPAPRRWCPLLPPGCAGCSWLHGR